MCVLSSPERERDFESGSPSPCFGRRGWGMRGNLQTLDALMINATVDNW
jgi:hypothetical protein